MFEKNPSENSENISINYKKILYVWTIHDAAFWLIKTQKNTLELIDKKKEEGGWCPLGHNSNSCDLRLLMSGSHGLNGRGQKQKIIVVGATN